MEFNVLGPLEARHEGQRLPLGGPRQRAFLALLLLDANHVVSRDRLVDELWPESPPHTAPKMVQAYVSHLRRVLPDGIIRTHPWGYSIEVAPDTVDLHRFERLIAEGRDALSAGDPRVASERLHEALALWRGSPLEELSGSLAVAEATRLDELRLTAQEARIEADLGLGRHAAVIGELESLISRHPLRERLRASQMLALYRSGRQADALAAYRDTRETLVSELGLEPSPLLRDLERRILEQDDALAAPRGEPSVAAPEHPAAPSGAGGRPDVHYADNGGVSLAYQVFGKGDIDLLLVTGWVLPMELVWDDPAYARFLERLASFSRVILWDKRGTGLSDRFPAGSLPTLEQRMEDLGVVMDAARCERAAIFGISEGSALAALFAAAHPDRTLALVLYGGFARALTSPDYPWGMDAERFDALVEHMRTNWNDPSAFLGLWAPSAFGDPRFRAWWSRALRLGASPAAALDWLRLVRGLDIREAVTAISVPAMVVHREGDLLVPKENARHMAALIPGATYVELPGEDHLWWLGDQAALLDTVEDFLTDIPERRRPERVLATVVVTRVDDRAHVAGRTREQIVSSHEQTVRRLVGQFGGAHVRKLGDALLATFPGPSRAIRCADAIRAAARRAGVDACIGVHTGECEVDDGDVSGVAVDVAAEIGALAGGGEVLASSTVEDLVAGSEIVFEDRGSHRGEAIGRGRQLLAVTWS